MSALPAAELRVSERELRDIDDRIGELSDFRLPKFFGAIGAELESSARLRIQSERRSPDGLPWAAWSTAYAQQRAALSRRSTRRKASSRKARSRGASRLLQLSGALRGSLTHNVLDDGVEIGSNLLYAAVHQFGFDGADKNGRSMRIPARPYLGVSDVDERVIRETLGAFITAHLEGGAA